MRRPSVLALPLVAILAAAAPLAAQAPAGPAPAAKAARSGARAHEIDKAHSEINFTAASRMLDAHGFFERWNAEVALDPNALESSSVRMVIDAGSINTRIERRDAHLRSPDFFDVEKHPQITFVSRAITRTSATAGTLTGDLTVRGVTKSVAIPVTMAFYENGRGRFRGTFQVNRRDYGITYNSAVNPIEDVVEVQFNMTLAEKAG